MSEENNKDYEFVTETIKKKPLNKKRLAVNTIKSIGMGIVAGLTACVIFAIFAPIIYKKTLLKSILNINGYSNKAL